MREDLLEFLFEGPIDQIGQSDQFGEKIIALFEKVADLEKERLIIESKPLNTALKSIGITDEPAENPSCWELKTSDKEEYLNWVKLINEPDNMHKLAEQGWVASQCGDEAMTGEEPVFKVEFTALLTCADNESPKETTKQIVQRSRKAALSNKNESVKDFVKRSNLTEVTTAGNIPGVESPLRFFGNRNRKKMKKRYVKRK
jgi:hypothetical protein